MEFPPHFPTYNRFLTGPHLPSGPLGGASLRSISCPLGRSTAGHGLGGHWSPPCPIPGFAIITWVPTLNTWRNPKPSLRDKRYLEKNFWGPIFSYNKVIMDDPRIPFPPPPKKQHKTACVFWQLYMAVAIYRLFYFCKQMVGVWVRGHTLSEHFLGGVFEVFGSKWSVQLCHMFGEGFCWSHPFLSNDPRTLAPNCPVPPHHLDPLSPEKWPLLDVTPCRCFFGFLCFKTDQNKGSHIQRGHWYIIPGSTNSECSSFISLISTSLGPTTHAHPLYKMIFITFTCNLANKIVRRYKVANNRHPFLSTKLLPSKLL